MCFFVMLAFAALPVVNSVLSGRPPLELYGRAVNSFELTFFPHRALADTYERSMSWRSEADQVTYDQYVADYVAWRPFRKRFADFLFNMFWPGICLGLAYFALFFPGYYPIRIDREKRLIYTQRGRHLYVKKLGFDYDPSSDWQAEEIPEDTYTGWMYENTIPILSRTGNFMDVLAVEMHRIDRPQKTRVFRMGEYPLTHRHTQGEDIDNVLDAFSYLPDPRRTGYAAKPYDPAWQDRLYIDQPLRLDWLRWLAGRTLGRRDRFDEAKVEAQLLDYAAQPKGD